jgi:DNA-binding MarR family transcriptional regulator
MSDAETVLDDAAELARVLRAPRGPFCPLQAAILQWLAACDPALPAPRAADLAAALGLPEHAIHRGLRRLAERGFIEVERRPHTEMVERTRRRRFFKVNLPDAALQYRLPLGSPL